MDIGPSVRFGMVLLPLAFGIGLPLLLPGAQPAWSAGTIAIITVSCLLGTGLFFLFIVAGTPGP